MSHFIAVNSDMSQYMYHRRNTGNMYESRTVWGPDKHNARVFTQKSAAVNAANQSDIDEYIIVEVELVSVKIYDK